MNACTIWQNANLVTMNESSSYGMIENGIIVVKNNIIDWIGQRAALPLQYGSVEKIYDVKKSCITPGLIDCHTHLVYAHHRADEFQSRMQGDSYEEIAKKGGGILSTVKATQAADEKALFNQSAKRLQSLLQEGVTTVEIKSGYGLTLDTERKMLRVAKMLGEHFGIDVQKTFLGAHILPKEFTSAKSYIAFLIEDVLPQLMAENLVDAVDAFCEKIAFFPEDLEILMAWAKTHHIKIKLHAEQLSNTQAAIFGAKYKALSVDHLEHIDEMGVKALKEANTIAVLLPGAYYFLGQKQPKPPVALFRKHQVPIAISTDSNPGTSPTASLLLMLNMACLLFGLTPFEALKGVTKNAAQALGYSDRGKLVKGMQADFVVWDIAHPDELSYRFGENRCLQVIKNGKAIYERISKI